MDVIAPVLGPGVVLVPDPGPATVLAPSQRNVLTPKKGTDLVPTPKNVTEIRVSLAAVADLGLQNVLAPGLVPVLVVHHEREKEMIPIT